MKLEYKNSEHYPSGDSGESSSGSNDAIKWYKEREEGLIKEGRYFLPFASYQDFELGKNAAYSNWVINGGESGHHNRPFDTDWARQLRDDCHAKGVPFFFKHIDKVQDIPDDLMVREFSDYSLEHIAA